MGLLSETGAGRGGMHPDAQIVLVLDSAGSYSVSAEQKQSQKQTVDFPDYPAAKNLQPPPPRTPWLLSQCLAILK